MNAKSMFHCSLLGHVHFILFRLACANLRSLSVISLHSSTADVVGSQPSLTFALEGSPNNVSTSVGLKYFWSTLTIMSPIATFGCFSRDMSLTKPISLVPVPSNSNVNPSSLALQSNKISNFVLLSSGNHEVFSFFLLQH